MNMSFEAEQSAVGEPWGRRLWAATAAVILIAFVLQSHNISTWPMADDEVPTLVELGMQTIVPSAFSVPAVQLERLPKALPVYYAFQGWALRLLPHNELGFRIPALICALITSGFAFLAAARWRGLWFGIALAILMNGSQLFVYLAQIDRFYAMPQLLLMLSLTAIWLPGGAAMLGVSAVLAALTILSHNVTVAVFVLGFLAACPVFVLGELGVLGDRLPRYVLVRSGAAAAISIALYFGFIRPLVAGWHSTGNPTPVMVSFVAHAGVPLIALAVLAGSIVLVRRDAGAPVVWSLLMFVGSLCFLQFTGMTWNPRYFLFFMGPLWLLAAYGVDFVAGRLGQASLRPVWYGCVLLLMLPNLLSHFQDGSRHDYRQAAAVLTANAAGNAPILSDDAETISFYLPGDFQQRLFVRTKAKQFPVSEFFLVTRSNAWTALPQVPGRHMDLLAEIYKRRFDQFSHILRVYRVGPDGLH
jgi:hypothetical protein